MLELDEKMLSFLILENVLILSSLGSFDLKKVQSPFERSYARLLFRFDNNISHAIRVSSFLTADDANRLPVRTRLRGCERGKGKYGPANILLLISQISE